VHLTTAGQTGLPIADIIGWDVANWSGCLAYWQPWLPPVASDVRVLVLGERNGGISLWFALLGYNVRCTDIQRPGAAVQKLHEMWNVASRVTYAAVDVFRMPWPAEHFDVVACKSVIGGLKLEYTNALTRSLENQKLAVEEIRRVLKPGGVFLGAENLTGTWPHRVLRNIRCGGKLGWRHLTVSEITWLFDHYSCSEQRSWGFCGTGWPPFPGLNWACAHADGFLSRLLPGTWLYISFIRARR